MTEKIEEKYCLACGDIMEICPHCKKTICINCGSWKVQNDN